MIDVLGERDAAVRLRLRLALVKVVELGPCDARAKLSKEGTSSRSR